MNPREATMRLRLFSDLHLECCDFVPEPAECDVVILAGDIHIGSKALPWIQRHFPTGPVLYLMGNHEYYQNSFPDIRQKIQDKAPSNVTVMENTAFDYQGYRFLGCTLWTDFELDGSPEWSMRDAQQGMNDYRKIRSSARKYAKLSPVETRAEHYRSVNWLKRELANSDPEKTIVVTHHAPSRQSISAFWQGNALNPAYASNLEALIEEFQPLAWLHGHTHDAVDYQIRQTRIICNSGGYRPQEQTGFDELGIIEL